MLIVYSARSAHFIHIHIRLDLRLIVMSSSSSFSNREDGGREVCPLTLSLPARCKRPRKGRQPDAMKRPAEVLAVFIGALSNGEAISGVGEGGDLVGDEVAERS